MRAVIIFGLILVGVGFGILASTDHEEVCKDCNVILISIDTLGAKHTSVHNPEINTTPKLQAFSEERGIVFEYAIAQSPWTLPSHTSMFTGEYPGVFGIKEAFDALPDSALTIAEVLQDRGYQTGAFSVGAFVQKLWGFDQGFDDFAWGAGDTEALYEIPLLFSKSQEWIEAQDPEKPFFLFIRSFLPHDPYDPDSIDDVVTINDILAVNTQEEEIPQETIERFRTLYQAEVKETDDALSEFLTYLEETELLENTILVITADHGEEFGEHGIVGFHAVHTNIESIHVPLILTYPQAVPSRVASVVEVRDIPTTILSLLGVEDNPFNGISLLERTHPEYTPTSAAYSETTIDPDVLFHQFEDRYEDFKKAALENVSVRENQYVGPLNTSFIMYPWHGIKNLDDTVELYNLENDPDEQENLVGTVAPNAELLELVELMNPSQEEREAFFSR